MYRVVVIEDDNIIRRGLIAMLGRLMLPCQTIGEAADGISGLELIRETQPDIVITDIKMPLLDGVEMISRAMEEGAKSKFLVISGFDDYQYVRNAMKNGASDYLLKPISPSLLEKSISQVICLIEQENLKEVYLNEINEQLKTSTKDIRELKLEKLLAGDTGSEVELDKIQTIIQDDTGYSVAIIENNQENLIKAKELYKQTLNAMKDEVYEFCSLNQINLVVTIYKRQIVTIINHSDLEEMEQVYKQLLDYLKSKGITGSISISDMGFEVCQMKDYYSQAYQASSYKIYCSREEKLLRYTELPKELDSINQIKGMVNSIIYQMVNNMEVCDRMRVRQQGDELLDLLYTHRVPGNRILEVMETLMNTMDKMIVDLGSYHNEGDAELSLLEGVYNFNLYKQWCRFQIEKRLMFLEKLRKERNKKIIEQVRQYIQKHYMDTITLSEVADYVNLSPNYLSEVFRREIGQTFIKYLIQYRIQEAKNLLQNTDYKIYQIAEMVGYKEVISFNRAFKNTVGMTPKEYEKHVK